MRRTFAKFAADQTGVTAIEAGLIAVILSVSVVAIVESIGDGSVLGYLRAGTQWVLTLMS